MKAILITVLMIGTSFSAWAERVCDSSRKEFFAAAAGNFDSMAPQSATYSCMACAMEHTEESWNRQKVQVNDATWDSTYRNTADISDRYWAMIGVAARQFYNVENNGQINKEELIKTMIRLSIALGPCREYYIDPNKPLAQQLRKDYKGPKDYKVTDLDMDAALTLSGFATYEKAYSSSLSDKERSKNQTAINKALGFKDFAAYPTLFKKHDNFNSLSYAQLREYLRVNLQKIGSDAFANNKAGRELRSCLDQLKANVTSSHSSDLVPAAQMCAAMTQSCFKNSAQKVHEICDSYGLITSTSPVAAPPASSTGPRLPGPSTNDSTRRVPGPATDVPTRRIQVPDNIRSGNR